MLCCAVASDSLTPRTVAHPPGSSDHGILQARILEFVSMLSSRGSPIKFFFKVLIIQHLVSREHFVFPSGILILSLPPTLNSVLPSYLPSEVGVGGFFLLWGNWLVSLCRAFPALVLSEMWLTLVCCLLFFSFFQRPQLEKVKKRVE